MKTLKTHCVNGHELTPETTFMVGNARRCRECRRRINRANYAAHQEVRRENRRAKYAAAGSGRYLHPPREDEA